MKNKIIRLWKSFVYKLAMITFHRDIIEGTEKLYENLDYQRLSWQVTINDCVQAMCDLEVEIGKKIIEAKDEEIKKLKIKREEYEELKKKIESLEK